MNLSQLTKFLTAFIYNLELAWRLMIDRRVPLLPKMLFFVVLSLYVLSPIDIVPDLIPVLGQMDDLAVFIAVIFQFVSSCPAFIVDEHKSDIVNGDWRIGFLKHLAGTDS